jgi:single-strand DNA-binding protein
MNTVSLTGNLTRDPELRMAGEQQRPVCELRLAVDNGPDRDPTYVDVSTFDAQAQACARYLAKGRPVAVSGRLIYREWKAEDGSPHSKHSVIGRVEFLGKRPEGEPSEAQPEAKGSDDDIPF